MTDPGESPHKKGKRRVPKQTSAEIAAGSLEQAHAERHQWLCEKPVQTIPISKTKVCSVSEGQLRPIDPGRYQENIASVRKEPPVAPINIAVIANKGIPSTCVRTFFVLVHEMLAHCFIQSRQDVFHFGWTAHHERNQGSRQEGLRRKSP